MFHMRQMSFDVGDCRLQTHNTPVVERRRDRGLRDEDEGKESTAGARETWDREGELPGSRPYPWNGAIGWSPEARGTVSGWKGKKIDWRVERTGRDYDQKRVVV
jgi:hypothetical protein